ncbi:hypothetical protein BBJ28_00018615 [Nothophytophthora sp. Chile5]|nr:hypothetical protein BBJ28_00018615 [Nothophytophthora sp. Chile5]
MVYTLVAHLYAKEGKEVEEKLRSKLIEASQVYSKDTETIDWHVMQDHQDPRKWCIVERYEHESPTTTAAKANSSGAALGSKDKNGVLTFGNDPSDDDDDEFATPLNPFAQ